MNIITKPAQDLVNDEIQAITEILEDSYHKSSMAKNFLAGINSPKIKQLCAYALDDNAKITATCVVKEHKSQNPHPTSANYPPIYFKHMAVAKEHRGQGIGSTIIQKLTQEAFLYFDTSILWSETMEVGALKLYQRLGAYISKPSVKAANPKISPDENIECIQAMIETSTLNKWRLPNDILFAWVDNKDKEAITHLEKHGFANEFSN